MLEETVKLLELKLPNIERKSSSVQTEISTDDKFKLQTENVSDFVGHMHGPHTSIDWKQNFKCHYCAEMFLSKSEVMTHRKNTHE